MRQGLGTSALCGALAVGMIVWSAFVTAETAAGAATRAAGKAAGLRQFTGVVTALDKATLTVEKRGKNPRSVVFTRHAEMQTTGEVDKNARVTVYYSDEGGKSVAHRVIAKPERTRGTNGGS